MCSHFNIEDGRKYTTFLKNYAYYFKKGKNATETHKKRFVQCVEKVLGLIKRVKRGLQSFVLEVSHWTMLQGLVDVDSD